MAQARGAWRGVRGAWCVRVARRAGCGVRGAGRERGAGSGKREAESEGWGVERGDYLAPRATRHAPRTTRHAPRTTHHAALPTPHSPLPTLYYHGFPPPELLDAEAEFVLLLLDPAVEEGWSRMLPRTDGSRTNWFSCVSGKLSDPSRLTRTVTHHKEEKLLFCSQSADHCHSGSSPRRACPAEIEAAQLRQ